MSLMLRLFSAVLTRVNHIDPDSPHSVLERHEEWLSNGQKNPKKWRTQIGANEFEGSCGCRFDADDNRTYWCGDHYLFMDEAEKPTLKFNGVPFGRTHGGMQLYKVILKGGPMNGHPCLCSYRASCVRIAGHTYELGPDGDYVHAPEGLN